MDNSGPVNHDLEVMDLKRAAGPAAVAQVEAIRRIGLGTAAFSIEAPARRMQDGLTCQAMATSQRMAGCARKAGIPLLRIEDVGEGAMEEAVPVYVLSAAFFARCSSPGEGASVDKLTSAMWPGSGGLGEIPQ